MSYDNAKDRDMILYNIPNFDNIFRSFLSVFMALNLASWSKQMYMHMDASGYFAAFFYIFIIFTGAFFSLNLFLAAILNVFTEMDKKIKAYETLQKSKDRILHGLVKGIFNKFIPYLEDEIRLKINKAL